MFGLTLDPSSTITPYINYLLVLIQIVLGFFINRFFYDQLSKFNSLTTLVILPIAPILSLTLFTLTRVKNLDYYIGYIFLIALITLVGMFKLLGGSVIVFSIMTTVIIYSCNLKQDGIGSVIIGAIICYLCKDMENPITVIISADIISTYITKRVIGLDTNRFKVSKEGFDNEGGNWTVVAGFLEAAFIGAPSDVISNNEDMMNGLADMLCVFNLLINGSTRGVATVVVTNLSTAIIFFALLAMIYFYNDNLEYIKEVDKVWPPVYSTNIKDVSNLELGIVVASLCSNHALLDYTLVGKLILVIGLFFFVRINVAKSLFFSTNLIF